MKAYYLMMVQHGVRVDWDGAVKEIEKPIRAEETRRVDQTTKFHGYQYSH